MNAPRLTAAALGLLALPMAGCRSAPQHAVPGCPHPLAAAFCKVEQFRDGLALEKAQWRTDDDTTELRLMHAKGQAARTTACVDAHVKHAAHHAKVGTKRTLRSVFCWPWRRR